MSVLDCKADANAGDWLSVVGRLGFYLVIPRRNGRSCVDDKLTGLHVETIGLKTRKTVKNKKKLLHHHGRLFHKALSSKYFKCDIKHQEITHSEYCS